MEVIQIAGCYPPHLGGEELVAERLATLQSAAHQVTVYTSDLGAGAAPRRERSGRLRVVRDRVVPVGNTPVVPRLIARLLRHRPRPDVMHVHTGHAFIPEVVRLASRLRRVPYVAHVHLLVRPSSRAGRVLLPIYGALFYGPFLRRADRVICLTDTMRDEVARTFAVPSQRIAVVPNGVDTDLFRPGEPSLRAERELLMVGRLTAQKNVLLVLEAMRLLPPDITLRVVGDGDLRDEMVRQIAAHGLTNVRLEGRLTQDELAVAYRRATAVLMPSSHEGLPLVLLEALSSGAPVICSALPELVEAGGDAVVTVDPLTAAGLAAAIENLLGDRARHRRLSETASRHAAGFGWPAVATAVDRVYQQVRTGARDRPPGPGD